MFTLEPKQSEAISVIRASLQDSFEGKGCFIDHLKQIARVGVIRYEVSLLAAAVIYYLQNGKSHVETLPFDSDPEDTQVWDKDQVKSAIAAIQRQEIQYPLFLERIFSAGVVGYEVHLGEGTVLYQGIEDDYTETFTVL